jgi:hypothetical protein
LLRNSREFAKYVFRRPGSNESNHVEIAFSGTGVTARDGSKKPKIDECVSQDCPAYESQRGDKRLELATNTR